MIDHINILPVTNDDLESLVNLRIDSMRPSLEKVGRFDPDRARERFVKNFNISNTFKIVKNDFLVGFYVIINKIDHLWLDHLYINPTYQGNGLGTRVINLIKEQSTSQQKNLQLGALKESPANSFYIKHGFNQIKIEEWDNIYQWKYINDLN